MDLREGRPSLHYLLRSACFRIEGSLLLHLQLDLVVDGVGAVLLVLSGWRLASDHLHLHCPWKKKLLLIRLWLRGLLVL